MDITQVSRVQKKVTMIRKSIGYTLYLVSFVYMILITCVKDSPSWWDTTVPLIKMFIITGVVASILVFLDNIRRYTYPMTICALAWGHKHHLIATTFSEKSYTLYRHYRKYRTLYAVVQDYFDKLILVNEE